MSVTIYQSIKVSLIALFKGLYPAFDVFGEEIARTKDDGQQPELEDYVFLDILPTGNTTLGQYHTDRRVLVDAAVHTAEETNDGYLTMAQEIDSALRPVFRFEDGGEARAVTVADTAFRIVDRVLHCTFTLSFRDSVEELEQPPVMEELETRIKTK